MKSFWLLSVALLIALAAQGQYRINGKIIDAQSGKAISGATVILQTNPPKGTYSGSNGSFGINNISEGNYQLLVTYLGYAKYSKSIIVNNDTAPLTISLKQNPLFIQPVEISSTRLNKDAPFPSTTLSGKELHKKNLGQDLPVLLKETPSVVTTSDAGAGVGYTGIRIRGSDATRTNVTINGIPVNDAESSGTFFVDIPDLASSTGSVQIQRGAGTSTNGAGAFGATVNISTNEYHDTAYADINSSYGSFNTWKNTVKAGTGLLNGHFTFDARLSKITSDGYIDRASSSLRSFYTSLAYFNKKTSVRLNVFSGKEKTYQAWDGVPEDSLKTHRTYNELGLMPDGNYYDNETDNYEQDYYQLFLNREINVHNNFNIALFLTRGKGYYEEYKSNRDYAAYGLPDPVIGNDTISSTNLIHRQWLDNYFYGTVFSYNHSSSRFSWHIGGGWNEYDGKHYGNVIWSQYPIDHDYQWYNHPANKYDFNVFGKGDYVLTNNLKAFLDLQYRHVTYDINGFKDNPDLIEHNLFDFFNPKAGLNYQLNERDRIYASYAVAHKEPNRDDFEANQNELPQAEKLQDWEAGFEHDGVFWNINLNGYYMNYDNQLVLTGKMNDVGEYTRTNIPESYRLGMEISGTVHFAKIFDLQVNATFSNNKIRHYTSYIDNYDNGKQNVTQYDQTDISFSPSVISGAVLSASPVKSLLLSINEKYVGRQYLDNTSTINRSLNPYFINDFRATYTLTPNWVKAINLNVIVNNLFNVKYSSNGATYPYYENGELYNGNYYFPQAGINFLAGINVNF